MVNIRTSIFRLKCMIWNSIDTLIVLAFSSLLPQNTTEHSMKAIYILLKIFDGKNEVTVQNK